MNIEQLREAYNAAQTTMREAADAVETAADDADIAALQRGLDDSIEAAERAKAELDAATRRQEALDNLQPVAVEPAPARQGSGELRVISEEPVYRPDVQRSFFGDLYRARKQGDGAAAERIDRHAAQVRDITTGAGADGVLPPQYLAEQFVDLPREGRPVANLFGPRPLPETGMTLTIPTLASGASVASQSAENAAVSETDADSNQITVPVRTIAGMQDVSRQAVDRTDPAFDRLIIEDLVAAYDEELDRQIVAEDGSSGQHTGLLNVSSTIGVTYTDASPTVPELLPKFNDALQQMWTNIYREATHVIMHPRRASWLAGATSTESPIFVQSGVVDGKLGEQGGGFGMNYHGKPFVVDANVPTNLGAGSDEDRIVFVKAGELPLFEGPLNMAIETSPGANTLTVRIVAYAYSAFAGNRRPKAIAVISGTGLVAPTF